MLRLLPLYLILSLSACQTKVNRQPNQVSNSFDDKKISLLKWAAKNRILFQIDEKSFHDVASSKMDASCETMAQPAWSELVTSSIETLQKKSEFKNSIHIVEIKPGAAPLATINQDLDGLTYLTLEYAKSIKPVVIYDPREIPCDNKSTNWLGQTRTDTTFRYPNVQDITNAIGKIKKTGTPERWNFRTQFLDYLASNMTVFRLTSDVSFEKSFEGEPLLVHFLNKQADQIQSSGSKTLNYWLAEINHRSHSGSYLNLFSLQSDKNLSYGIATLDNSQGVAMPFMSYKIEAGQFLLTNMTQLEKCLGDLTNRYRRSLASIGSDLSTAPQSFLYPGFSCR
jgi:hypothetical protein